MSNPAVTELQRINTKHHEIWIDDNIGESIHLHIDDARVDFSIENYKKFCNETKIVINKLVEAKGFNIKKINLEYFEYMLASTISHLKEIRYDEVELENLLVPAKTGELIPLAKSWHIQLLKDYDNGVEFANNDVRKKEFERLKKLEYSLAKNGYPYNNQFIILYNDDNIIQDGHHRAACLYKMYGNISVKVQRFIFDNYTTRDRKRPFEFTILGQIVSMFRHPIAWARKKVVYIRTKYLTLNKNYQMHCYLKKYGDDYRRSKKALINR